MKEMSSSEESKEEIMEDIDIPMKTKGSSSLILKLKLNATYE